MGQEDLLEKEMAPHTSILACEISWTEQPGRSSCLFNLYADYIMQNARLDSRLLGEMSTTSDMEMIDTSLITESEEELKSLLMKVKVESEKVGLKLSIQKTKIMASSPITSWQMDGEKVETVTDFIFLGSRITADGDCSYEIKTLAPWKKSYDKAR